jgi:hypothetical protein
MKAVHLIQHLLRIPAEHPTCPLTGTKCDAPHLRAALSISSCKEQKKCPIGKHRRIIPLIQIYDVERQRKAWRERTA